MSDRPSEFEFKLKHILPAVKDVATEWHELGLQLDLLESDLKLIGSNPDVEGHLRMMLSEWLDYDTEASWDKLANALNSMGKNVIAANIRSKYVRAAPTTPGNDPSDDDTTSMSNGVVSRLSIFPPPPHWASVCFESFSKVHEC